ncbi:MAG: glycosyltransferase family 4 protein [Caldilineaceae bacterium]|nr:glycosyltransferase family 4 protein [Caldilineaceae bacterium]
MHVAIDAQLLSEEASYRSAGVSNYSRQLLHALGELVQAGVTAHSFTAYVHTRRFQAPGIALARTRLPLERPELRILWEQCALPWHLRAGHADIVHGLVNVLPLATRAPGVVTVHDLSFMRTPGKLPPLKRAYLTLLCRLSVQRAAQIIAVSQQTAGDLAEWLGTAQGKLTVVYNGVAPEFSPPPPEAMERIRTQRALPQRFLLYVGTLEPRKNLEVLVRAYSSWRQQAGPTGHDVELVLAGARGWYYDEIFAAVRELGLEHNVHFPGFIPTHELPALYGAAEAFIYPSLFEGFGLPVLEAMACGAPVICSQAQSLLEVAGDAALTFPPHDVTALAHAIQLLLTQPRLRERLQKEGRDRAARFSWRRTAEATLAVYDQAAAVSGR